MFKSLFVAALALALLLTHDVASAQKSKCDAQSLNAADQQQVESLIKAAVQFEDNGQLDSAIEMNKQILGICNDFAPAMTTIAGLYGREGKTNSEIEWAQKAIATDPKFVDGYINLANGFAVTGRVDMARTTLNKAMSIDSANPIPYYTMGVLAEADADEVAALDWYSQSMNRDSTFPPAYFNAALIYIQTGEFDKAQPLMQHVTDLDPGDQQAQEVLARLNMEIVRQRERGRTDGPNSLQQEGAFKS